jgi:hypothetical protein
MNFKEVFRHEMGHARLDFSFPIFRRMRIYSFIKYFRGIGAYVDEAFAAKKILIDNLKISPEDSILITAMWMKTFIGGGTLIIGVLSSWVWSLKNKREE